MKKLFRILSLIILLGSSICSAQEKVSTLPVATSFAPNDIFYLITYPFTGTSSKQISGANTKATIYSGISGNLTINSSGVAAIGNGQIANGMLASGINANKISGGTISNTIFDYLSGLTSNIQAQIDALASGMGTVTSVSITTVNGISGSVGTPTTTPAISLTLGNITPTSVAATSTVTGSNLSGNNTGDQTTITGNAGTATALQTPRAINGVNFDGTSAITVPAAAATLTGNTLATNVLFSNLTSVGTLGGLTVTNPISGSVTGNAGTVTTINGLVASGTNVTITGSGTSGSPITINATGGGGSGTVTTTSVVSANGFAGTVANATTTPAITLTTTASGILKGNATAISAATAGTDYVIPAGNVATATALATGRTISITGDLTYTSPSFNGTGNVTAAGTLATVNSNVGSFTCLNATLNSKGLVTAASNGTCGSAPGGSDTQLQYNNAGAFGGISGATTDGTNITLNQLQTYSINTVSSNSIAMNIENSNGADYFDVNNGTGLILMGADGASTNISTYLEGKGTGSVFLGTNTSSSVTVFSPLHIQNNSPTTILTFPLPTDGVSKTINWPTASGTLATTALLPRAGSFSGAGTATTTFTVTIGVTEPNNTYKVNVTPTSSLSAALFYVTNKTTTTFDVVYLAGLTGTVTFDWSVFQ